MVVEKQPIFPGGEKALFKFIIKNVKYPEEARRKGVEGRVLVSFIIEKDGSISNIKLVQGIGYGCDEEALRVISKLPKFTPGKHSGFPVRVQTGVPINFRLPN
ncbi:MAG: energy transducer TonB [Fervidobacterium pennivorans]